MVAKTVDIGSKRLVSLAPESWARWLTDDATVEVLDVDLLSSEFQWVARANDLLIKARSPRHGTFLIANEMQFRPDPTMPQRIRAYAALAEERYKLNVYSVVVNILPPKRTGAVIADSYHLEFMGQVAHHDYRVLNLWELDADRVLEQNLTVLLPFVPILHGGQDERILQRAAMLLRADERVSDMELLLALFASLVLEKETVLRIMRWDMAILRESTWYSEAINEGLVLGQQKGQQEGQVEMLLFILNRRLGAVSPDFVSRIRGLGAEQLHRLADVALVAPSLDLVVASLATLTAEPGNGNRGRG